MITQVKVVIKSKTITKHLHDIKVTSLYDKFHQNRSINEFARKILVQKLTQMTFEAILYFMKICVFKSCHSDKVLIRLDLRTKIYLRKSGYLNEKGNLQ